MVEEDEHVGDKSLIPERTQVVFVGQNARAGEAKFFARG